MARLQTPTQSGQTLIEPALDSVAATVESNRRDRTACASEIDGRSLETLARDARRELFGIESDRPIFMTGHQPQMFHPGVWLKDFTVGRLAKTHKALAVHLSVDGDLCKSESLPVPGGTAAEPHLTRIPFDGAAAPVPFEERRIADRGVFTAFGNRAAETLRPLVADPLLLDFWPRVVAASSETDRLGECISIARRSFEREWGLDTVEVRQSRVCTSEAFARFAAHVLTHLPRFRQAYNGALAEYRAEHHLRNAAQPIPDLASDGDWLESPFWLWTADDPTRRPLFARTTNQTVCLSDRRGWRIKLPTRDAAAGWLDAAKQGVRLRSRALTTTLFARLALCDFFVHGIGGAKYDRIADAILARFFGLIPPGFLTVSGTLHLPIERPAPFRPAELDAVRRRIRETVWNPDRCLIDPPAAAAARIAEKQRRRAMPQTKQNARVRCAEIRAANAALQPWVENLRADLELQRDALEKSAQAESVATWREYAFCLYPESTLRPFLTAEHG